MLHRLSNTSAVDWQGRNRLRAELGGKCDTLPGAVSQAMARTPHSFSLGESLNARLHNDFTLRRHLGNS